MTQQVLIQRIGSQPQDPSADYFDAGYGPHILPIIPPGSADLTSFEEPRRGQARQDTGQMAA